MAVMVTCPDCNATFTASNQWLASVAFDAHKCEKHPPVILHICPILQRNADSDGQRDLSVITTMEILEQVKKDAEEYMTLDAELWQHLESRIRYMLNAAGLR